MTDGDFEHNGFYMFQSFLGMPNSFLFFLLHFADQRADVGFLCGF